MTFIKGNNKIIAIENDEKIIIAINRNKQGEISDVKVNGVSMYKARNAIQQGKSLEVVAEMLFTDKRIKENYRERVISKTHGSVMITSDGVVIG